MTKRSIIFLDDDAFERQKVTSAFAQSDRYTLHTVDTWPGFLKLLDTTPKPDIILLDVHLSEELNGVDCIKVIKKMTPHTPILMYSSDLSAVRASLLQGADDFVLKSKSTQELLLRIETIAAKTQHSSESRPSPKRPLVGPTMKSIRAKLEHIIPSAVRTVFVHAESGSGKEVVASIIKDALAPGVPFFSMNCAALSAQMLESELFGHVKGAFTGALQDRKGYLESASGGWLFMDEVANLTLSAQGAILRAIDNQEIIRLGESKVRLIDTRIVCATNESLPDLVKKGTFRNDLWQRLKEVWIEIPPLRERKDEIPEFVEFFAASADGGPYQVTSDAMQILQQLDWTQGNVRAIRNCIRAMTASHSQQVLSSASIPEWVWQEYDALQAETGKKELDPRMLASLDELSIKIPKSISTPFPTIERLNDLLLIATLHHLCKDGAKSYRSVATVLGLPRSTLFNRVKKLRELSLISADDLTRLFGESA